MKECFKCGRGLPIEHFYRHSQMADGHLNKCKDCARYDVAKNYRDKHEAKKSYDRMRNKNPERRTARLGYQQRARGAKPEAYRARTAVANALARGALEKPEECSACGAVGPVQGHHADYKEKLEVEWLCLQCHRAKEGRTIATRPLTLPPGREK